MTNGSTSSNNPIDYSTHSSQTKNHLKNEYIEAINALFTMLEDAYPLKFRAAYNSDETIARAKRLWSFALKNYSRKEILQAAKLAFADCEFFPDLADFIKYCKQNGHNHTKQASPRVAYREACAGAHNPLTYKWSNSLIYLAGKKTGWLELRSETTAIVFPIFAEHYKQLIQSMNQEILNPDQTMQNQQSQLLSLQKLQNNQAKLVQERQKLWLKQLHIDPEDANNAKNLIKNFLRNRS